MALADSTSRPPPGVLFVTSVIDGWIEERAATAARPDPRPIRRPVSGSLAPLRSRDFRRGASAPSGVHFSTNFREVMLLCGPELIQNSFV